jgi:peptidoglycan hydrolase-like protein with peptidoglycan-binding domain
VRATPELSSVYPTTPRIGSIPERTEEGEMVQDASSGRCSAAALAATFAAGALALGTTGADAQQRRSAEASSLRAVEVVEPSSGETTRSLVRPLTASERLRVEAELDEADHRPGEVDGTFDESTARALRAFQREHELEPCGCVDLPTAETLGIDVRVVMTEIASAGDETRASDTDRPDRSGTAAARADVEMIYPSSPVPAPEPAGRAAESASGAPAAQGGTAGAAAATGAGPPEVPVTYHRGGAFAGTRVGVPFFVVDSAGNLVPFTPGVPVIRPAAGQAGQRPGARGHSRHRVPFPPNRTRGRPPTGGGGGS